MGPRHLVRLCLRPGLLALAGLLAAGVASAQPGRFYDPKSVVTVQGLVEKLETVKRRNRELQVLHLRTDQGLLRVLLGPPGFLAQRHFPLQAGDALTVTGAKVSTGRGEIILAAELKAGDQTLVLRDSQGAPVWQDRTGTGKRRIFTPGASPSAPPP